MIATTTIFMSRSRRAVEALAALLVEVCRCSDHGNDSQRSCIADFRASFVHAGC
jgi:hypothetical protein